MKRITTLILCMIIGNAAGMKKLPEVKHISLKDYDPSFITSSPDGKSILILSKTKKRLIKFTFTGKETITKTYPPNIYGEVIGEAHNMLMLKNNKNELCICNYKQETGQTSQIISPIKKGTINHNETFMVLIQSHDIPVKTTKSMQISEIKTGRTNPNKNMISACNLEQNTCQALVSKAKNKYTIVTCHPNKPIFIAGTEKGSIKGYELKKRLNNTAAIFENDITKEVTCIACNPKGNTFAVGLKNGFINLYNHNKPEPLITLKKNKQSILSIRYSPDGKYFVSTSKDSVQVWTAQGARVAEIKKVKRSIKYAFITDTNHIIVYRASKLTVHKMPEKT